MLQQLSSARFFNCGMQIFSYDQSLNPGLQCWCSLLDVSTDSTANSKSKTTGKKIIAVEFSSRNRSFIVQNLRISVDIQTWISTTTLSFFSGGNFRHEFG
ncbi:hypothetical protein GQ457_02G003350 [Hibiscus cannabinus]